eukprot:UN34773
MCLPEMDNMKVFCEYDEDEMVWMGRWEYCPFYSGECMEGDEDDDSAHTFDCSDDGSYVKMTECDTCPCDMEMQGYTIPVNYCVGDEGDDEGMMLRCMEDDNGMMTIYHSECDRPHSALMMTPYCALYDLEDP